MLGKVALIILDMFFQIFTVGIKKHNNDEESQSEGSLQQQVCWDLNFD